MKKFTSTAVKWLALISILCVSAVLVGIIFFGANVADFEVRLLLTVVGGNFSFIFILAFFAERSRWLKIDDYEIILPRGAIVNDRTSFSRTVIRTSEISSLSTRLQEGVRGISKDTYFHTITLNDGEKITFTLYAFGKKCEKEILETIKNIICINKMLNG